MLPPRVLASLFLLTTWIVVLVAVPASGQANEYDGRIHFNGPHPSYEGPTTLAVLESSQAGQAYTWRLQLEKDYTILEIRVDAGFDIERPRQLVPELDDAAQHPSQEHLHPHFFQPLTRHDVSEVDSPARVYNLTEDETGFTYRLGIPGPGPAALSLRRDVTPPVFTVGEPSDITHIGFMLETTTDEFAYGSVQVARPDGEVVPFPTPLPSLQQTYPVQGLQADTDYNVTVVFTDWSGNEATAPTFMVRTAAQPYRPIPEVVAIAPVPESTVAGPNVAIEAQMTSPESPITREGVRLFVDKQEVFEGFTVEAGRLSILVGPLEPGLHSVSVEVTNVAGGTGRAAWIFTVEDSREAPGPAFAVVALGVMAVAVASRRRG